MQYLLRLQRISTRSGLVSFVWIQLILATTAQAGCDADRAFRDLVALTRLGPRAAGTEPNREAQQLIAARFRQAGWTAAIHAFESGGAELGNVIARRHGARGDLILVLSHHDTARFDGPLSAGANDGASGPALLMELARQLATVATRSEIWLASCDGSHPLATDQTRDRAYHGSRELLRILGREGRLSSLRAVLVVDRVAGRSLHLAPDARVDARLQRAMLGLADRLEIPLRADPRPRITHKLDVLERRSDPRLRVAADHVPFFEAGIDAVVAIVGGVRDDGVAPVPAVADDLANVSPQSLARVGNLVLELVRRIDAGR
jgi:hypothetical protein